jgi:hypothetical protein
MPSAFRPNPPAALPSALLLVLVVLSGMSHDARAASAGDRLPSALCEQAVQGAEAAGGTPPHMLAAIAQIESGRPDPRSGAMRPWPWTIDANGAGQFFPSKTAAIAAVIQLQAQGVRSIDVGCMQVNLLHHPDAFASLDQAFDPKANAAYAVRFLKALYVADKGDWKQAIASYHSNTRQIGADYETRVLAVWQQRPASDLLGPHYADSGLFYGPLGTTGRVYGLILPNPQPTTPR